MRCMTETESEMRVCTAAVYALDHCPRVGTRATAASGIKHITRTAHSEALIVRGTGYDIDHLDQPRASLSLSADIHPCALTINSYGRMHP
jgi:hypothetical protein